jgi:hypothetical protein
VASSFAISAVARVPLALPAPVAAVPHVRRRPPPAYCEDLPIVQTVSGGV